MELTDASGGGAFKMRKNSSAILYTICVYTSRKSPKRGISERNGKAVSELLLTKGRALPKSQMQLLVSNATRALSAARNWGQIRGFAQAQQY